MQRTRRTRRDNRAGALWRRVGRVWHGNGARVRAPVDARVPLLPKSV
jgi:hypothetical protein